MRAFVVTGPGRAEVKDVDPPVAGAGQVVIEVERAGLCGTDHEFFTGAMAYLHQGHAAYPMRLGHEWIGRVIEAGDGVDGAWIGRRVTGDTMLPCGHCARCSAGRGHLCADRAEVGIRHGWAGALAERLAMPVASLHVVPDAVDDTAGALAEPGANALRAELAAELEPGQRILILGAGAIGLMAGLFARAHGAEVHLLARSSRTLEFARGLGMAGVWTRSELPRIPFDVVLEASNDPDLPSLAAELVEPGGRVVYIGLSGDPSLVDTRTLVLKEVVAAGVLSGYGGIPATIAAYASGDVDARPLVAATIGLDEVAAVLDGRRPAGAGHGPKIHVDPTR